MPYQNPFMPYAQYPGVGQPQGYQQYQQPSYQQPQQPIHGFVYVTGVEGAKAYQMPPNSEMPLFDSTSDDRMFIKTTDGAGFPTIRSGRFIPDEMQPAVTHEYATLEDVNALHKELDELRESIAEVRRTRGKPVPTTVAE